MKKKLTIILCAFLALLMVFGVIAPLIASAAKTTAKEFEDNADVKAFQNSIAEIEAEQAALKKQLKNIQNQRYSAQQQANDLANLFSRPRKR